MKRAARCIALWLVVGASPASAFQMRGSVVSSGAQHSSGAAHTLRGTVGQAAVGGSNGASFFVCHGFWCFGGSRVVSVAWEPGSPGGSGTSPRELALSPPMPNPARGLVRFTLALPQEAEVSFEVVDVAGRRLGEPVMQRLAAGTHELRWSAPSASAGVYFGRLSVEGETRLQRRVVLIR